HAGLGRPPHGASLRCLRAHRGDGVHRLAHPLGARPGDPRGGGAGAHADARPSDARRDERAARYPVVALGRPHRDRGDDPRPARDRHLPRRAPAGEPAAAARGGGDPVSISLARPAARRLAHAYFELTKPRIVSLVLMTGVPALLLAARGLPSPRVFWGAL